MLRRLRFPVVIVGMLLLFAAAIVVAILLTHRNATTAQVGDRRVTLTAQEKRGQVQFRQRCGSCHTLASANTQAKVGPNLDLIQPPAAQVAEVVAQGANGAKAAMPAGLVPADSIPDVAAYVARVAYRPDAVADAGE